MSRTAGGRFRERAMSRRPSSAFCSDFAQEGAKRIKSDTSRNMITEDTKLKLPIKPTEEALSFFSFSTSPEKLSASLVFELDKIKRSIFSGLRKVDESFASDVAAKIEYQHNSNGNEDPFVIKKKLEVSDVGHLCRLILKKDPVEDYILPFCATDEKAQIHSGSGIRVSIYDQDTRSYHMLMLKRWSSNKTYILNNNWMKEFVKRRSLNKGDWIGLYWDSFYSCLCFSVIKRA